MTFPLSKEEKKALSDVKEKLSSSPFFTDKELQLYKGALSLMEEEGLVQLRDSFGRKAYVIVGDMAVFDQWVKNQNKKAKKLSRREWRIAVAAAIVGAVVGLLPTLFHVGSASLMKFGKGRSLDEFKRELRYLILQLGSIFRYSVF